MAHTVRTVLFKGQLDCKTVTTIRLLTPIHTESHGFFSWWELPRPTSLTASKCATQYRRHDAGFDGAQEGRQLPAWLRWHLFPPLGQPEADWEKLGLGAPPACPEALSLRALPGSPPGLVWQEAAFPPFPRTQSSPCCVWCSSSMSVLTWVKGRPQHTS